MDGFSYNDIFDTKGIEYLVIIGFFAILIPFWILLSKRVSISENVRKVIGSLTMRSLKIPQGIFFSGNHTWAHMSKTGSATVGLDDMLLHITGDINLRNLKKQGEQIAKNEMIGEIVNNGNILKILAPVSGEILEMNSSLLSDPGAITDDPYHNGWIYRMKPSKWSAETRTYRIAEEATAWFEQELVRFKDFLSQNALNISPETARLVLQDGGEISDHSLAGLPPEVWSRFQEEFLSRTDIVK